MADQKREAALHRARQASVGAARRRAHRARRLYMILGAGPAARGQATPPRPTAEARGAPEVVDVQVEVPKLSPPAPFS